MNINEFAEELQTRFPLTLPFTVKYTKQKERGLCSFDGTTIEITIKPKMPRSITKETMIHEWAHARLICSAFTHDENWGREYSRIYQQIIGDV